MMIEVQFISKHFFFVIYRTIKKCKTTGLAAVETYERLPQEITIHLTTHTVSITKEREHTQIIWA